MKGAYYNEIDPYCATWLRNLIAAGHIAPGEVDERSIVEVKADELRGFEQCHFFAGIGGWSYALRLAGWPDDRPVWTGSCPCQPFSGAGERAGFSDERDLWPAWFELIRERSPSIIIGEQVASKIIWLDRVFADLENESYAVAAAILPACAVDAPHRRDRLWFVADAGSERRQQIAGSTHGDEGSDERRPAEQHHVAAGTDEIALADTQGIIGRGNIEKREAQGRASDGWSGASDVIAALADADRHDGFWWSGPVQVGRNAIEGQATASGDAATTQWRVKPGVPLLANGVPNRVERLCAYGNAIVPQVAAEFIKAVMVCRP